MRLLGTDGKKAWGDRKCWQRRFNLNGRCGGGSLRHLAADGEPGPKSSWALVHWPSTSGEVGVSIQFEFGVPGSSRIGVPRIGGHNSIQEFRCLESDSGPGQGSVRLQKQGVWWTRLGCSDVESLCSLGHCGELGDRTGKRGVLTTLYSAVTVGCSTAHKCSLSVREAQSGASLMGTLAQADSSVCVVSREVSWVEPESWESLRKGV